ncbi:MAG: ABC transporter ATP-binding protein [Conexivisphaerales archaeon]
MQTLLSIESLNVEYRSERGVAKAVQDVSIYLKKGETLGLVGESGSGKSTLGLAIMRLIQPPGRIVSGRILFEGNDLLQMKEEEVRKLRGEKIAMIFQDPMTSLNPVKNIEEHFIEYITEHRPKVGRDEARKMAERLISDVGISASRLKEYPHQFSGGMRQRVMIALALTLEPLLIIADEPTTSLDVMVEAQILELMRRLKEKYQLSLILITHNMGIVAEVCDRVAVMYAGRIAEISETRNLFRNPMHPYTSMLIQSIPNIAVNDQVLRTIPGNPPDLTSPPSGCPFHPRCPFAFDRCRVEVPKLKEVSANSYAACHLLDKSAR